MLKIRRPVVEMSHSLDDAGLGMLKKRTDMATAGIIFFFGGSVNTFMVSPDPSWRRI